MGCYYYLKNPNVSDKETMIPVAEDEYVNAIYSIAKKQGVVITDAMIAQEIFNRSKKKDPTCKQAR